MITVSPCPDSANCSNVPSSASLLNSASNDRSDDSSAATQSTPGAMSRSSDNCTLRPSGNRVVTIEKEHERLQQLLRAAETETQFTAYDQHHGLPGADAHCASSRRRVVAAALEIMMRNHECHAAAVHVLREQRSEELRSGGIEIGKGLIEQPKRRLRGQHPGHDHAAPLSSRQNPHRQIRAGADTRALQDASEAPMR